RFLRHLTSRSVTVINLLRTSSVIGPPQILFKNSGLSGTALAFLEPHCAHKSRKYCPISSLENPKVPPIISSTQRGNQENLELNFLSTLSQARSPNPVYRSRAGTEVANPSPQGGFLIAVEIIP